MKKKISLLGVVLVIGVLTMLIANNLLQAELLKINNLFYLLSIVVIVIFYYRGQNNK